MSDEASRLVADMRSNSQPRWLSFVGKSGTGKTMLANAIRVAALCIPRVRNHHRLLNPVLCYYWPDLLNKLRNAEHWRVDDIRLCNFLMLDDITVEHDPNGFGRGKLCDILSSSTRKWVVITSNLTLPEIDKLDSRIASRMVRDGSVVVEVDTIDYALR